MPFKQMDKANQYTKYLITNMMAFSATYRGYCTQFRDLSFGKSTENDICSGGAIRQMPFFQKHLPQENAFIPQCLD